MLPDLQSFFAIWTGRPLAACFFRLKSLLRSFDLADIFSTHGCLRRDFVIVARSNRAAYFSEVPTLFFSHNQPLMVPLAASSISMAAASTSPVPMTPRVVYYDVADLVILRFMVEVCWGLSLLHLA